MSSGEETNGEKKENQRRDGRGREKKEKERGKEIQFAQSYKEFSVGRAGPTRVLGPVRALSRSEIASKADERLHTTTRCRWASVARLQVPTTGATTSRFKYHYK